MYRYLVYIHTRSETNYAPLQVSLVNFGDRRSRLYFENVLERGVDPGVRHVGFCCSVISYIPNMETTSEVGLGISTLKEVIFPFYR